MDIYMSNMRDRRIAASDEYLDGSERRERTQFNDSTRENISTPRRGRFIYGRGSAARRASYSRPATFNVTRYSFSRDVDQITTIILHSTGGRDFDNLPDRTQDSNRNSYHRIDEIIAHFVICQDGSIVYTHDIENVLNCAGGGKGIDIEFAGSFDESNRLSEEAISSGRALVSQLKYKILNNLRFIHPHGQVQRGERGGRGNGGKYDTCSGPDVWVNVGQWSVDNMGLTSDSTDSGYPNHGISSRQSDSHFLVNI